jgi:hypothetical protein
MSDNKIIFNELSLVESKFCLLKNFIPFSGCKVQNDFSVIGYSYPFPYANIEFFCKNFNNGKILSGTINHKIDFTNFWDLIKFRKIDESKEEVVFWYTGKNYKNFFIKLTSSFMPKFIIAVIPKGTFDRIANYDLGEELFTNLFGLDPISFRVPDVMNKKGYPNK